ncbi:MAG: ferrous iron transport protein B [Roseburia sp.]|nr:ferrous iron transport protein B [Anaeroplasma bactoclasticum]MCM1196550.1 ferrous iron transport protein B [Roseburia sp.]MCM1557626.1 ferrous iron transport protein B [Anaeroplasma bactoclasticum]
MAKRCCLVGNQNSGKTLLFNVLTGMNQKVGNWPGVTVERKDGIIKGTDVEITDLPGIYSLSPYTQEEEVSRKYVVDENPDLIINIIDSTSIERALYLTTQLLELNKKVLVVLNMEDILAKKGYKIDSKALSEKLGTTVVSISALKKTGIKELIQTIDESDRLIQTNTEKPIYPTDVESLIENIIRKLDTDVVEKRFAAVKIIEKDSRYYSKYYQEQYETEIEKLEKTYGTDTEQLVASLRYDYIEQIRNSSVEKKEVPSLTQKIDRVLLNKWAAIPIFLVVMVLVYLLSVGFVGGATVGIVDLLFNGGNKIEFAIPFCSFTVEINEIQGLGPWLAECITNAGGHEWAASLVADGAVAGVGAVLNFVPQIAILFLLISLLETCGYMSRVTFLFDRAFKKLGMSGKSLIPFIVGTGCSVPAIMGTRTLEDKNEHEMTVTLTPFMPCSAKLPIILCFIGGIFAPLMGKGNTWIITFLMYILAIVVIVLAGFLLNKFFVKNKTTSYITELPEYHAPSASYVGKDVWEKTWAFIKRAGTIIFLSSVIIWVMLNLDYKFQPVEDIEESLLANLGRTISWIFAPMLGMNFSWGASVSAVQGLVAKEMVVSSMEVITAVEEGGNVFAGNGTFAFFNGFSAMGYMVFTLFSAPCFGAIGAMRRELGSSKAMWKAILFETGLAWVLASVIGIWGVFC